VSFLFIVEIFATRRHNSNIIVRDADDTKRDTCETELWFSVSACGKNDISNVHLSDLMRATGTEE
jgi:hypothetical protein